jgi:hypothetical protein
MLSGGDPITPHQIAGIYVVMGACAGLGLIVLAVGWLKQWQQRRRGHTQVTSSE